MNIYLPEERFVEQVPGDVFNDGSVAGEDGLWAVEPLAMKGKGSLSLVPDSNPKPEVTLDPTADFAGIEEDDGDDG